MADKPPKKQPKEGMPAAKKKPDEKPAGETDEYALGDDFLADLNEEEPKAADKEPAAAAEEPAHEDRADEGPVDEEAELEQIINAETEEWDGIDPDDEYDDEDDADHADDAADKTLVHQARSKITSGFEAVGP
ncbi:MAG: hypothetical protein H0V15_04720, partial [Solirubrobacterales bacterium]|nr:hypothetical protein [Solirubrobacterales bacterium]